MGKQIRGRHPKYYFLVYRLKDHELYCAASIAQLLQASDLRLHNLCGELAEARFKARQSLARIARVSCKPYEGLVRLTGSGPRNVYPGFRGSAWKSFVTDRVGKNDTKHEVALKYLHGA